MTLPHCWVCGKRFNDLKVNPGPAMREEHHIIPRAYGGADGPTVSLCDLHHTTLHKIAVALKAGKSHYQLTAGHNPEQHGKLMLLATRVYEAEQATRNDPNKKTLLVLSLDGQLTRMVDDLKSVLPGVRGREAVARAAITSLWNRHFMGGNNGSGKA